VNRVRPIASFDAFRDIVAAYRLPRILLTALDLDLFTVLADRPWPVPALAKRLKVSVRGLDIICRNLATAGLLRKVQRRYRNVPLGETMLNAGHPSYRGAYLELIRRQWADWSQLTKSVRSGKPVDRNRRDDPAYRRQFTWAMHHRSVDVAEKIAARIDLRRAGRLLDLGGGPGTFAMAFLRRNPRLQATVCDRPAALAVAKRIAQQARHGRRLSYLPLDFIEQPIPGQYDVVWYSNVLHIYSPATNQALFRRLRRVVAPGGRLLIQDAFCWDRAGLSPAETNLFAVTMLLFTEEGNTYAAAEVIRWLKSAGFGRVRRIPLPEGAADWEGGLIEASQPRA
jgi:SAM-dependent methyltransferase